TPHPRLRLRRGASVSRATARLPSRRGGGQLGRSARIQGRSDAPRPHDGLRDAGCALATCPKFHPQEDIVIAKRAQEIEPFLAVEVFQRAQAMEREGIDVVHLMFGEPDFDTPSVIREAAEKALKDGRTRYAHTLGILPLREAIAEHYRARYGVTVSPDQVLVTAGTSPAMLLLFTALLDPGDHVVLSDPHYACYPKFVKYAQAEPLFVPVDEADAFQFKPEDVRSRLTPDTKAILINSPANPTATVLGADRMAALASSGPWILSDDIYHCLTYE